jgi:GGDEF domain-containing protein
MPHGQQCSAGIAVYQPGESTDDLLQRADKALYEAKNSGRGCALIAPEQRHSPGAAKPRSS